METTTEWFASPMNPDKPLEGQKWGVYYNVDTISEDFRTGEELAGLQTEVIAEYLTQEVAEIIAATPEMLEVIEYYHKGADHFFKRIDFSKSFLDAEAINFVNEHILKMKSVIEKVKGIKIP